MCSSDLPNPKPRKKLQMTDAKVLKTASESEVTFGQQMENVMKMDSKVEHKNMIHSKSFMVNNMRPIVPFIVDTTSVDLVKNLDLPKIEREPVKKSVFVSDVDVVKKLEANFQKEGQEFIPELTLASSMTNILKVNNEKKFLSIFGHEFVDNLKNYKYNSEAQAAVFKQWISNIFKSKSLSEDLPSNDLKPIITLGEMASRFLKKVKENSPLKEHENAFSILLCKLLCLDLKLLNTEIPKLLEKQENEVQLALNKLGSNSLFARQLFRQHFQDVPSKYLKDTNDITVQDLYANYSAMINELIREKEPKIDLSELTGQTFQEPKYGFKYSRYDVDPTFSVGILDLDFDITGSKVRKDYCFRLPKGAIVDIISRSVLNSVYMPSFEASGSRLKDFCYPKELEQINKIHSKIVIDDFSWLRLVLDKSISSIRWLEATEPIPDYCYCESQKVWYLGYDEEKKQSVTDESAHFINKVKNSILVPICNTSGHQLSALNPCSNLDLILVEKKDCTVNEFLDKLNITLKNKKIIAEPLTLKEIYFQNMREGGHPFKLPVVKSGGVRLTDVLAEVGYEQGQAISRTIPYVCSYLANSTTNGHIPSSTAVYIKTIKQKFASSLMASVSDFFDFLYNLALDKSKTLIGDRTYIKGHSLEFFLPQFLFVDVEKLSCSVIDIQGGLSLRYLEKAVKLANLSLSTEYGIVGFVIRNRLQFKDQYYDFSIKSDDETKMTSTLYGEMKISELDLHSVKYVAYQRKVKEQ